MATKRHPRRGSMQFWPRVRSMNETARIRKNAEVKEAMPIGFAGYKVGMTHVLFTDGRKNSATKGEDIVDAVTVIECPPLKVMGIRFYKKEGISKKVAGDVLSEKFDKELGRRIIIPKKHVKKIEDFPIETLVDVTLIVHTQPKLTGIGKKKPEIFEVALGGKIDEKLAYAKDNLGKELPVSSILKEGQQVDVHAVTVGKGTQGPVKRFGVSLRSHKAEKTKRGPGSLGPWHPHHGNYRVPHAGKMGYHQRTQYNQWILKIGQDTKDINPASGWKNYGVVKNNYIMIKGSVGGPAKRLIRMTFPRRASSKIPAEAPTIQFINV